MLVTTSFLLLLVFTPAAMGLPAKPLGTEGLQWLHVKGSSIVREDGATMILRGTNLPELDPSRTSPQRYALYLDEAKSMGFNIVRLPISWAKLEPSRGEFSTNYLNSIQKIATLSQERGIYVVLDMHQFRMNGFPSWILAESKTEDRVALGFWSSPALQAELIQAWRTLASLLKDEEAVAGYDLLNEPYGGPFPWQEFAPILNDFYSKLISEIRSIDSGHMIFFEPVEGTSVLGEHVALRPEGANLVFSPHLYIRGSSEYLENVIWCLYNLTVNSWNIPTWIGEFGGVMVEIGDYDSLSSLGLVLDLLDRYKLGWAYWSVSETSKGPTLVDGSGHNSPLLTATISRIYPTSYIAADLVFSYNGTPRFHLEASATSEGFIRVTVPRTLASTMVRCINCVFLQDDNGSSLTIQLTTSMTAYFYMDAPDTVTRLRQLATSELQEGLKIAEGLRGSELHSSKSRSYVDEIMAVVEMMRLNFTATHYESVLGKLDEIRELRALSIEEESNHTRAKVYVDSVRQGILDSQGFLGKWQSTLLSQAYESLSQGDYSSAEELAKKAGDLPREPAREKPDPSLRTFLWTASLALLGIVTMFILFQSVRRSRSITIAK